MKRCFIVTGSESSGTRLLTQIMINAGCTGDAGHSQKIDDETPTADLIVIRRSMPHSGKWINLFEIAERMKSLGYVIHYLIIIRDWHATASSQMKNHVETYAQGLTNIKKAYRSIFGNIILGEDNFTIISYEAIVTQDKYINKFLENFELKLEKEIELTNQNLKYYK